jgi:hypothetical protein
MGYKFWCDLWIGLKVFLEHFRGHVFYCVKHYMEIEDMLHMIVKVNK